MVGIMDGFAAFGGWGQTIKLVIIVGIPLLIFCGLIVGAVLFFMMKKKQIKIIEVSMSNRVRIFYGRLKKTDKNTEQFWVPKLKRYLPMVQTQDLKSYKGGDCVFLLRDQNGFYHTLRLPDYEELVEYYFQVHDIDLKTTNGQALLKKKQLVEYSRLYDIYMLPNPHENLDWLAGQIIEANKEFSIDKWWKSPVIAYIGVGFVCMLMFLGTLILGGKVALG